MNLLHSCYHSLPGNNNFERGSEICIKSHVPLAIHRTERQRLYLKMIKGMFLHNGISSPLDSSKRFTLHQLADLFIPPLTQLFWEAFIHAVITVPVLFTLTFPPLSITGHSFIQLSELKHRGENENCSSSIEVDANEIRTRDTALP